VPPNDPECADEVCLTCGDVAVPFRIVELRPDRLALVTTRTRPDAAEEAAEEISVALVAVEVGDVVLVHAKEAIAVLDRRDDWQGERGDDA
jgi:hydrogenase maturation factor